MRGLAPLAALAVTLALPACTREEAPAGNRQEAPQPPAPAAEVKSETSRASGEIRIAAGAAAPTPPAAAARRRCGWLANPTPGNWWLTDSQGQWILGTQGAKQAPGMDDLPDMSTAGWVETNGHYGYGCACITITADGDGKVTRIADAKPKPLKQCRADRKLPRPE
jgi:hypothetical protein